MNTKTGINAAGKRLLPKNLKLARTKWGGIRVAPFLEALSAYTLEFQLSLSFGDLILLDNGFYVTHVGLIRLARRRRCAGIDVKPIANLSEPRSARWTFRATVYRSNTCKGFTGYGDAEPSNVSLLMRGSEMRIAETRAVNRALRKAYGIGICSVEELGAASPSLSLPPKKIPPHSVNGNSKINGPRVRDRLCQLIRQHQLDPNLVKSYAIDYCGTKSLRDATREQLENFVVELGEWAAKDRNALVCQLNSYMENKAGAA